MFENRWANISLYELAENDIDVAGIEMIVDEDGVAWTYDVNTNTNYNPDAEAAAGLTGTARSGPGAVAAFLGSAFPRRRAFARGRGITRFPGPPQCRPGNIAGRKGRHQRSFLFATSAIVGNIHARPARIASKIR